MITTLPEYSKTVFVASLDYCWPIAETAARRITDRMKSTPTSVSFKYFNSPAPDLWLQLQLFMDRLGYAIEIEDYIPNAVDPEAFGIIARIYRK